MQIKIQTERLYLREFTEDDAELLHEMHQDPAIGKYVADPVPWSSVEQARHIIRDILMPQYENGIGRWAVHLKTDHTFIGWCGLKDIGDSVDLGYRYIQKFWGNGYAQEAASAVLKFGIEKGLGSRMIGRADVDNTASLKVLEKIGLVFDQYIRYMDETSMSAVFRVSPGMQAGNQE